MFLSRLTLCNNQVGKRLGQVTNSLRELSYDRFVEGSTDTENRGVKAGGGKLSEDLQPG